MKILGFIQCHYAGNYARESLLSIAPFCDKIHIAYSTSPSHGFGTTSDPPETEYEIRKMAEEVLGDKLIWTSHPSFISEQAHRNERYRYSVGMSLILSLDLDEILTGNIEKALEYAYDSGQRFYGTPNYKHFIKGTEYYFYDNVNAPIRIENLLRDNLDYDYELPLEILHMSLSVDPEIMAYKLNCFGHKNEINPEFFEKWLHWNPNLINEITDLHPTQPLLWHKPIKFTGELPEVLKNYQPKIKQKMKILYIPLDYHRYPDNPELFKDIYNSFLLMADTMLYQGDINIAINFKPDIILFQGSLSLADCIVLKSETKALFCMMTGDCRYAPMQSLMDYRSVVDVYFLPFSGVLLDTYKTLLGKPCHFLWEYIQEWRFKRPKMMDDGKGSISFVGNLYEDLPGYEGRMDLINFIRRKAHHVSIQGNGCPMGEISNLDVPDLYNNSYIVIAENNHTIEDYFTPRNLGGMAAGSCTLMKYFPGIEKFFQNMMHCVYYRDKYELLQWIDFLKNNPSIRNEIASNGYGLALTNFNTDMWVKTFMQIINKNYLK